MNSRAICSLGLLAALQFSTQLFAQSRALPNGQLGGQPGAGLGAGIGQPQANAGVAAFAGNSMFNVPAAIKCIYDLPIAAQTDGLLQELMVDEGSAVEKGQLLFTTDERLALAELAVASKEAEAAAKQASQDANLRFSKKVAEVSDAEYEEIKDLYDRNAASLQETRRKLLEAQKARLGIEVADVDHSKDILTAEVAKEKVNAARVQLTLRKVTSQYDGIIVERKRAQGEWVKAGEPILRLVHMKEMRVEANVPVRGASVALLQNANLRLHININGEEVVRDAKIEYVSPVIEMNTCRIWARVPNTFLAGSWIFRDGMEATVDIQVPGK